MTKSSKNFIFFLVANLLIFFILEILFTIFFILHPSKYHGPIAQLIFKSEINNFLPGAYTVLLPSKKSNLSPLVQNGSTSIGVRIPDHFFPVQLVKLFGKPIITTSINRHGNYPLNDVSQVEIDFPNVDIFEDSSHSPSKGSTIINYSTSPPEIIRHGDGPYPL